MDDVKELLILQSMHEEMMAAFRHKRFDTPLNK